MKEDNIRFSVCTMPRKDFGYLIYKKWNYTSTRGKNGEFFSPWKWNKHPYSSKSKCSKGNVDKFDDKNRNFCVSENTISKRQVTN